MATTLTMEDLSAAWETFFRDYYKTEIEEAAVSGSKSILIDYKDIDRRDITLAEYVLDHPTAALYTGQMALRNIDVPVEPKPKFHLRVKNLPETAKPLVRDLRASHLGKFVAVEGLIKKAVEVRPKLEDAAFKCPRCGNIFKVAQEDTILTEPQVCDETSGGCGRPATFKLLTDECKFIDHQKIEIQESPEGLRGGAQPQRLTAFLEDDIVSKVAPGDRVILNGVLRSSPRRKGVLKLTEFDKVLDVVSVEQQQEAFEEVVILPEEEERIRALSQDPILYDRLRASFAPEIYGLESVKDALILALFAGVPKELDSGIRIRGDIHILLVGDPGTAKSQLLQYVAKLAPRSIYTSGKGASAAGLTAAAVRDEFGEGQWTLEAGALVLADLGVAAIDEMDKMQENDQSAMHQAMEQQEVSIAKAGITATLKSRCSVVGAANPKLGRFDEFTPIAQQIDMPVPLLTRFDLIFSIKDKPDRERDTALAEHVLRNHKGGEVRAQRRHDPDSPYTKQEEMELLRRAQPDIDPKLLRKYVAFAKRSAYPVMKEDALQHIQDYYVDLRLKSQETKAIAITARQLEAFVRLAEASARIRLSTEATLEDAQRAIGIVEAYLRSVGVDRETGSFDIDMIAVGSSHSQQDRMRTLMGLIRTLAASSERGRATREEVLQAAEKEGIARDKAEAALNQLKRIGQVIEPTDGTIQPV